MAVYKQTYRRYTGALTPPATRFLVLYRFARQTIFQSKALLGFYVACFLTPLVYLIGIYLASNLTFLAQLRISQFLTIDRNYFYQYVHIQGLMAFYFTAFAGPGLISPDLANGGLALYLSRPLSRMEYLLGKMSVLLVLLTQMMLLPGLILWAVQASLGGAAWRAANTWIAASLVWSCLTWILLLSLLSLALSAWLRWKIVAGAIMLAILFFGAGLAQAVNTVLRTRAGSALDLFSVMQMAWGEMFRRTAVPDLTLTQVWLVLLAVGTASLWLILRRVKAFEVVK